MNCKCKNRILIKIDEYDNPHGKVELFEWKPGGKSIKECFEQDKPVEYDVVTAKMKCSKCGEIFLEDYPKT